MNRLGILMAFVFAMSTMFQLSFAQQQKGADIDGEAINDGSGISVSMPDVNTLAIGATGNSANGLASGHVRVYRWNGSAWIQKGLDLDGEDTTDLSGWSVSMPDANTVGIGAVQNDGGGLNSGHVRIYRWNGGAWVLKGGDIDGAAVEDGSGFSVSMPDANTVAIGAPQHDGNGLNSGHVRIFRWNGSGWVQKGADIHGEAAGDASGSAVNMPDSNTVAIGALYNNGNGMHSGHVRVYSWNGSAWIQKGVDLDGEAVQDFSGTGVSMSDPNTVAIGANSNDGNGSNSGHVRVYRWNGNAWVQKGSDIDGEAADNISGGPVDMPDSNTVAIGAPNNGDNGPGSGHVRIYRWSHSRDRWVQKMMDIDGEAPIDGSGSSVSMPDPNTVAIGADDNDGNGPFSGHVRVYSLCSTSDSMQISDTALNTYTWGANNQTYTVSGRYEALLVNDMGCDSLVILNLTVISTVGIDEKVVSPDFELHPNPARNWITIKTKAILENPIVSIYDSSGRFLKMIPLKNHIARISLAEFGNGLYFVQYGNRMKKFVISR